MGAMIEWLPKVIDIAKSTGRLCYLYGRYDGSFYTSFEHRPGWLFLAWPGGKRELSPEGVRRINGI